MRIRKTLWWIPFFIILILLLGSKDFWRLFYPLPHKSLIVNEATRNDLDPFLVAAIIKSESNFSPGAESRSGARGIMQIMPETAVWAAEQMGLKEFHPDQLYDLKTNIKIGCWYLHNLNTEFAGNKILVIAAYNGGRGNVREWLKSEAWSGEHSDVDRIPFPETREYVKKVLKYYKWYRYIYQEE